MSLWKRVIAHPEIEHRMQLYYDEKGLADVRVFFADWMEKRIMSEGVTSSIELYKQNALQFYEDLKQQLVLLGNSNLMKYKLPKICTSVTETSAVDLYTHIRNGFQKEFELLDQMPQNPFGNIPFGLVDSPAGSNGFGLGGPVVNPVGMVTDVHQAAISVESELFNVRARISTLRAEVDRLRISIQRIHDEFENFLNYLNEFNHTKHTMPQQQHIETERQINEQYQRLINTKMESVEDCGRVINEYDILQTLVINELKTWQRNQALSGNGARFRDNLDEIQNCIEVLVELICIVRGLLRLLSLNVTENNTPALLKQIDKLLRHVRETQQLLVLSSFIVEKQPPQVMKTNTRFAATVRWLIGSKLGVYMNNPTVECIILSEAQAQRHSQQRLGDASMSTTAPPSSGEILNNMGSMEFQQSTGTFSANFRNMQLKKIKRAEKKGTESVMDEKFALLFFSTTTLNEYKIQVWTLSLPVVVIVHGNQEPQSWATITWDNAFSEISREPFQVPEKVSWSQLSYALNTKFSFSTGRELTHENLNYIYEKLFRNDGMGGDDKNYITWAQFCKEPLPDRAFTFWDWFYAIMKLTKDYIQALWQAGLVVGFINKGKTHEDLAQKRVGTFLLRFSDSELGGITVAFKKEDNQVLMLAPWTAKDLQIRALADRIYDLQVLERVYPNDVDKNEAFGAFYTQTNEIPRNGYVLNTIRAHVPAIESVPMNTPQHQMQSPHPHDIQMSSNSCLTTFHNYDTYDTDYNVYTNSNDADSTTAAYDEIDWDKY